MRFIGYQHKTAFIVYQWLRKESGLDEMQSEVGIMLGGVIRRFGSTQSLSSAKAKFNIIGGVWVHGICYF
jgi:hypothetical protein